MKKHLFYLLSALFLLGCAEQPGITEPVKNVNEVQAPSQVRTRSLESAVYNEAMDTWMIPQPDPYSLANFQKAYDNLAARKSLQTLTRSQEAEFASAKKLDPTHYALRIYPRSEEEQWLVETMDDVKVVYLPFDYSQLTQEEVEVLPQQVRTRTADNTFTEKSPYTVTYENYEVTGGGPTGPVTFQLPILYAVWPADKPLPEELEYVVDYEVFLPNSAIDRQSVEALFLLEREAVYSTLGVGKDPISPDPIGLPQHIYGYIDTYDNQLNSYVPVTLKVTCQFGTNILNFFSAGPSGQFSADLPDTEILTFPSFTPTLTITYQDPLYDRWKIVTEGNTIPYSISRTVTFEKKYVESRDLYANITLVSSNRQENEIQRAATYFYYAQNDFPKHYPTGGLRIIADNQFNLDMNGFTTYSGSTLGYIHIYNNGSNNGKVIGTALHEIGHCIHFINDPTHYKKTPKILRESFGSYSGWYLGEKYYQSLGWIHPGGNPEIAASARQSWTKTMTGSVSWYSPLFIDLTDSFNQNSAHYSYLLDEIGGVSASEVWDIISTCNSWEQCRPILQSYVGTYYPVVAFINWVENFDYWFEKNTLEY